MNEELRKEIKLLKALQGISYTEVASYIPISSGVMYNWLSGSFNFSEKKQKKLQEILCNLKE